MEIEYKDLSIKDLKLNLIIDDFKFEDLLIIKSEIIELENIKIKASIVGASHVVSIFDKRKNKYFFNEIIANYFSKKEYKRIYLNNFNNKEGNFVFKNNFIDYNLFYKKIKLDPQLNNKEIMNFYKNVENNKNSINLYFNFDKENKEKLKFSPETILSVKYQFNKDKNILILNINSLHFYPKEKLVFKTISSLKINCNNIN